MLVLTRAETESLLDPDRLREAVAAAMVDVSAGRASAASRIAASVAEREAMLVAMPAHLQSLDGLAAKLVTLFPHNAGTGRQTHQAVVVVFDAHTGEPAALLYGTSITAARTAAASALSVQLLARPDVRVLAVLGTGVQARSHLQAVQRVRAFEEVVIAGRSPDKAREVAEELRRSCPVPVTVAASYAEACRRADVVCAVTHSPEPVVVREHIRPGTHITSVGYNVQGREVDSRTVADALVVVESRDAALAPPPAGANDLRVPIEQGLIAPSHVHAELGELLAGTRPGRAGAEQVTLYKSVGIAAQDVAAAALVLAAARTRGLGTEVSL